MDNLIGNNTDISNLPQELTMAREFAILGQYSESVTALNQILKKV